MQCPIDGAVLTMSERNGIEIDYCPTCRGVWLDRGELDKIVERSLTQPTAAPVQPQQQTQYAEPGHPQTHQPRPYKKKKESWLSELFE